MTTVQEENKYWSDEADELHHDALKNMRGVATKWQAAVVAVLGTFATVAFIWGPEKLKDYPLESNLTRWTSLILLILAGICGIGAAVLLAFASIGIPRKHATMTGPELEKWTTNRARSAGWQLYAGMIVAGVAALLALSVSAWLLLAAAKKDTKSAASLTALVSDGSGVRCGDLSFQGEKITMNMNGTPTPLPANAVVTIVDDCPG